MRTLAMACSRIFVMTCLYHIAPAEIALLERRSTWPTAPDARTRQGGASAALASAPGSRPLVAGPLVLQLVDFCRQLVDALPHRREGDRCRLEPIAGILIGR